MAQTFVVRLRGGSYENIDGTRRQDLITKCKKGDPLILKPEPENPHDRHAVAVLNSENQQLGYLPSDARDSSCILRGEEVTAIVLKRIGGPNLWHKIVGKERHYGLLLQITKGEIDWNTHNKHRAKAQIVDNLIKTALSFEKSGSSQDEAINHYNAALKAVLELNQSDPTAAAHRYEQAPINRLTILLVKQKRFSEAKQAYEDWSSIADPIGITKPDQEALRKRMIKIGTI